MKNVNLNNGPSRNTLQFIKNQDNTYSAAVAQCTIPVGVPSSIETYSKNLF